MYAPCRVDSPIVIEANGQLIIKPSPGIHPARVEFGPLGSIEVYWGSQPPGRLLVQGEAENPIIMHWDTAAVYTNINSVYGHVELKHAVLEGAGWVSCSANPLTSGEMHPVFRADSCTFRSFGEGIWCWGTDSTSYLHNCTLEGIGETSINSPAGFGTALTVFENGALTVENCTIRNSGEVGLLNWFYTDCDIRTTSITGSGQYGILNWEGANLDLECSEITGNGDTLPEIWVEDGCVNLVGGHNLISDSSGDLIYSADPSFVDLGDGENSFELLSETGRYLHSGSPQSAWDITLNHWLPDNPADPDFYDRLEPSSPSAWVADTALAGFLACGMAGASGGSGASALIIPRGQPDDDESLDVASQKTAESHQKVEPFVTKDGMKSDPKRKTAKGEIDLMKGPVPGKGDYALKRRQANRAELLRQHHAEQAQWRGVSVLSETADPATAVAATKGFIKDHPGSKLLPAALAKLAGMGSTARSQEAAESVSRAGGKGIGSADQADGEAVIVDQSGPGGSAAGSTERAGGTDGDGPDSPGFAAGVGGSRWAYVSSTAMT